MKFWVANTDRSWVEFHAARPERDEVNFWSPNPVPPITLAEGSLWLFKHHVRDGGQIVGGGYFAHYSVITPRFAWEAFGAANGAGSFDSFIARIRRYASRAIDPDESVIGSSILVEPFFLPERLWIDPPSDWSRNLTRGKSYDATSGVGTNLWEAVQVARTAADGVVSGVSSHELLVGYGPPTLVKPRLGQGAFRVVVTDAYERRCVITGERTLPVLEAAHIRPYAHVQVHEVTNGLLLRSDLHRLFDLGYLTVTPKREVLVSRRIQEQFANGRDYYALEGRLIRSPMRDDQRPSTEALEWHASNVFRG